MAKLQHEIRQNAPFSSLEEEVFLNAIRTGDRLQRSALSMMKPWRLTLTQYNVLRILRGSQSLGLSGREIADLMVTPDPDITRLLARLQARRLIRRKRSQRDGRVITAFISPSGLALLDQMDEKLREFQGSLLGHMTREELQILIPLLEKARAACVGVTDDEESALATAEVE